MSQGKRLPDLLWSALRGLKQNYVFHGAGRAGMPSLDMWANALRVLGTTGTDLSDLPTLTRLSKRAVRSRVGSAVRNGWAEESKSNSLRPQIRLSSRGSEVAERWVALERAAEQRWRAKVGSDVAYSLRLTLEKIAACLPLEHPHYPASYGAADASITGGGGKDWKPVPRTSGSESTTDLSISALLSQAITAFAMRYEEKSPVALTLSSNVITQIPATGRALQGLGDSAGLSALLRHGFVRVTGTRGLEMITLTDQGHSVSKAHLYRVEVVETEWRSLIGDETFSALNSALLAAVSPQTEPLPARESLMEQKHES